MERTRTSVRLAAVGLGLILLGLVIYASLAGVRSRGIVTSAAELPFVGKRLDAFRVTGPIRYVCIRSYIRPVRSIVFTSTTTKEHLGSFFGSRLERPGPDTAPKWHAIFESMSVKAEDFPIGVSEEDLSGYRELGANGRVLVVRLTWRARDQRFTAYVIDGPAESP